MTRFLTLSGVLALVFLTAQSHSYYLPGVEQKLYAPNDALTVHASKLSSDTTQIPYEYFSLNYCHPEHDMNRYSEENYGMALSGIVLERSAYLLSFSERDKCQYLCPKKNKKGDIELFKWYIERKYRVNFIMDNMPAIEYDQVKSRALQKGIPVGHHTTAGYHVMNHYGIRVRYHKESAVDPLDDDDNLNPEFRYSVIGLYIIALPVHYGIEKSREEVLETCTKLFSDQFLPSEVSQYLNTENLDKEMHYTYHVTYIPTDITWKERWAEYLQSDEDQGYIHWLSILNSCMVVIFLTGIVAHILSRTLNRDIATYNSVPTDEEFEDQSGWKQLQGDVFRPPRRSMLLSALVGNGAHLLAMAMITVILAGVGVLSPARRGAMLTSIIYMFVLTSNVAGFVSARFYKMMNGPKWFKTTILTALGYTGVLFGVFFLLNFVLYLEGSSGNVSFVNLLTLLCLWFLVSTPFTFLGSLLGYKRQQIENPCKINKIPRPVPQQKWYLRSKFTIFAGGLLPFGSIFIELYFIMSSMWGAKLYYMFGLLFLVVVIMIFTCAEISIVICYFQLCKEDYRWWWRSFLTAGATGVYLFGYSVLYFFFSWETTRLSSTLLFFGYMSLASITLFVITGTVGFVATYIFVRQIYQLVKFD
eukprot:CAMPEP_0114990182 /NCGR_PEP_ID=MMETSP0216-20121206/10640_1 /TAXON_ID=223996 /ORGANISM="Protocruzia adherens, Strain Boccale" /LENGTH=643 /DNA_ID=CAMNT_0002353301 /DNA_START=17 /DNA_END=1948 /DNA_ORIENTATION=-